MAYQVPHIRTVNVSRYVTPLREGGSMPGIIQADDDFMYVLKFRGAGQGIKALIAELIGSEVARAIGFHVPEVVFAQLGDGFAKTEPDEEIQDLLKFSIGLNLGLHYLSGAITFDPLVTTVDALTASKIVWLDSFLTNMDRTARNTNMLIWHHQLWLIDHGAALYFHHNMPAWQQKSVAPFPMIANHVLLKQATMLPQANDEITQVLTPRVIQNIVNLIPADWYHTPQTEGLNLADIYYTHLTQRLAHSPHFVTEADHARLALI